MDQDNEMIGLWLENNEVSLRTDLKKPTPVDNEAVVKVLLAGICATDLELIQGYYPYTGILGHEFVGELVELPEDHSSEISIGQRVVGEINASCGECDLCIQGSKSHCRNRTVLGIVDRQGTFAEFIRLPLGNLHPVPNEISIEQAVFTEPIASAVEITTQIQIQHSDRILLIGAGRLGILIADVISKYTSNLIVSARYSKQKNILQAKGIRTILPEEIEKSKYNIVIEATGSPDGLSQAINSVKPRGIIVLKSTYHQKSILDLSEIVVNEISLIGSRCGPFPPALDLMRKGQIDPLPLIDRIFPLDEAVNAIECARQKGVLKVLLKPGT